MLFFFYFFIAFVIEQPQKLAFPTVLANKYLVKNLFYLFFTKYLLATIQLWHML